MFVFCVHVYVCVYMYVHAYVCKCVCVCVCACVCVYVCMWFFHLPFTIEQLPLIHISTVYDSAPMYSLQSVIVVQSQSIQ